MGSLTHILTQRPGPWVLEMRKSVMHCTASRTTDLTGKSLNVNLRVLVERTRLPMQEMSETGVQALHREDPLEEEMAAHSSILNRRIPRTEEPGGLHSRGLQSQT